MYEIEQTYFKSELKETAQGYEYVLNCPDGLTYGSVTYNRQLNLVYIDCYSNGGTIYYHSYGCITVEQYLELCLEWYSKIMECNILEVDENGNGIRFGL